MGMVHHPNTVQTAIESAMDCDPAAVRSLGFLQLLHLDSFPVAHVNFASGSRSRNGGKKTLGDTWFYIPGLVNVYKKLLKMAIEIVKHTKNDWKWPIEIVELPMKHDDFP